MERTIKDIAGNTVIVTNIRKAIRQCKECLGSPYKMEAGYTVGENHAYMLRQLLELQHTRHKKG